MEKIFKWMINFSVLAGEALVRNRGKLSPIIKDGSNILTDSSVKTILDDVIQELFLSEVYLKYPEFLVNAEEDTPLKFLFQAKNKGEKRVSFLHLDPLDGTKSYLDMNREFTVGMAISDNRNNFTHTVIYAPMFNKIFTASPKRWAIFNKKLRLCHDRIKRNYHLIYEKKLLSEKGQVAIKKLGFVIKKPLSSHLSILKTALHESGAFLYGGAQVHDGFIPLAFVKAQGLKPQNVFGEEIKNSDIKISIKDNMPVFLRLPSLCYFSSEEGRKAILDILSVKENLHPEYLKKFAMYENKKHP